LDFNQADKSRLVVEPLAHGFKPASEISDTDHAAPLVAQARQDAAQTRAAFVASLQQESFGHLAQ